MQVPISAAQALHSEGTEPQCPALPEIPKAAATFNVAPHMCQPVTDGWYSIAQPDDKG